MKYIIYHNPRCSKSRQTLALLQQHGIEAEIIEYLNEPPDADTLRRIVKKLGLTPHELLRTKEKIYKELGLADSSATDAELLDIMAENPILIERPIVVHGNRAVIGRPPENVLELL